MEGKEGEGKEVREREGDQDGQESGRREEKGGNGEGKEQEEAEERVEEVKWCGVGQAVFYIVYKLTPLTYDATEHTLPRGL